MRKKEKEVELDLTKFGDSRLVLNEFCIINTIHE
jgi:hypothetical protein